MLRLFALLVMLTLTAGQSWAEPRQIAPGRLGFSDRDPVDFKGKAPGRYAIHGIDLARFQDSVDWRAVKRAGVSFAFIKATEGGDLLDPKFKSHWRGAGRVGIRRGAYHFYYFCTAADVQARWFIRNVPRRKGALPPVLDLEWNPFSPTCKLRPPAQTVRREATRFLDMLEAHYGQRPIIYTTPGFYKDAGLKKMRGEEFWLRSTAKNLRQAYPGQTWSFWQYSSTGIMPGISGDVDLNLFEGSARGWTKWLTRRQQ